MFDTDWIQGSRLTEVHHQLLAHSCMVGSCFCSDPSVFWPWCCLWAATPKAGKGGDQVSYWYTGQSPHPLQRLHATCQVVLQGGHTWVYRAFKAFVPWCQQNFSVNDLMLSWVGLNPCQINSEHTLCEWDQYSGCTGPSPTYPINGGMWKAGVQSTWKEITIYKDTLMA